MALDIQNLLKEMLGAASQVFSKKWPDVKDYAEEEFKKFSRNIVEIERMKFEGKITEEKAKLQMEIQKNSIKTVLLAVKGIGMVTTEQAINAAIDVVRNTVNTTIGWKIL